MLFLLLDVLLSYTCQVPTFFVLINILLYSKKNIFLFILIPLVLDLLIVNTYFLNTMLFIALFILIKHLNITQTKFNHYILLITIIYILYVLALGLINGYSMIYLFPFMIKNYIKLFIDPAPPRVVEFNVIKKIFKIIFQKHANRLKI